MTSLWKLAAMSAILAGLAVAATEPTTSRAADPAPALRGTADLGPLRCDTVGGWPFFDPRCSAGSEPRRQVRKVGMDSNVDRAGPFRVTEVVGPILR